MLKSLATLTALGALPIMSPMQELTKPGLPGDASPSALDPLCKQDRDENRSAKVLIRNQKSYVGCRLQSQ